MTVKITDRSYALLTRVILTVSDGGAYGNDL